MPQAKRSYRLAAVQIIQQVIDKERSLSTALPEALLQVKESEQSLLQHLCYGFLRHYLTIEAIQAKLLQRPLKKKDRDVGLLMMIGIYQLREMNIPDYAVISECVDVVKGLRKVWAKGIVNAVLRNYLRQSDELSAQITADPVSHYAYPRWLIDSLQRSWPEQWQQILEEGNRQPPMTLRLNRLRQQRDDYLSLLSGEGFEATPSPHSSNGLTLSQAVGVEKLPGFNNGDCSVQDSAAQLAAQLLAPKDNELILDACTAPGGKCCHLLEINPSIHLLAVDIDANRLKRVEENLKRLQLTAEVKCGDAANPIKWWDGTPFDAILLDAPCSATGVIRRHPDIKHLRRAEDILQLVTLQAEILNNLWSTLKPGGRLLYATCSILPEENEDQLNHFCNNHSDARAVTIDAKWGITTPHGRQIHPGMDQMDGFFYGLIEKRAAKI